MRQTAVTAVTKFLFFSWPHRQLMRWPTNAKRANASDEYVAGVEGRRTTERQGARHQQEAGHGSHAQDGLLGMSAGFLCAAAWYCVIDHSFTLPSRVTSKIGLHPVLVPFLPIEMSSARVRLPTADTKKSAFFCVHPKEEYMRTMSRTALMLLGSISLFAFGTTATLAASPSQQQCTEQGGTFSNESGTKVCVLGPKPVGNCQNDSCQTTTTTDTGQGNLNNKPTSKCSGPPGQCK